MRVGGAALSSARQVSRLQQVDVLLGLLAVAFIGLLVIANRGCGPAYFERADVVGWVLLALALAVALFWAASADDDRHRIVGSIAAGGLAGVWLGTVSLPIIVAPLAIVAWFRVPRMWRDRVIVVALLPVALAFGIALPYLVRWLGLLTPAQYVCG